VSRVRRVFVLRFAVALAIIAGVALLPAAAIARSPRLGSRTLREGMKGSDVKTLQTDLTQVGLTTRASGYFGSQTVRSVRRFERGNHLVVNGLVGRRFVRRLGTVLADSVTAVAAEGSGGTSILAPAKPKVRHKRRAAKRKRKAVQRTTTSTTDTTTGTVKQDGGSQHLGERTLRKGMHGHDVRVLQGYLTLVGYPTGVDGDFGPATKANVIQFEQAHGLNANGVVTYADSLALRQAVALALVGGAVSKATINSDGTATAPSGAPAIVQKVIAAANKIIDKPYVYAGGHAKWNDSGYDCSGAVSYALHGGGLLSAPEDSTGLESYGSPGPGKWITIYADSGHTWVVVAGIAFDTADYGGPNIPSGTGPRWRSNPTGNLADGGDYVVRHPSGL
jgi:peptidoglycan hydrolase-like protein with peptidoglycan-binding domain